MNDHLSISGAGDDISNQGEDPVNTELSEGKLPPFADKLSKSKHLRKTFQNSLIITLLLCQSFYFYNGSETDWENLFNGT